MPTVFLALKQPTTSITTGEKTMRAHNKGPVTQRSMPLWPIRNKLGDPFGDPIFQPIMSLTAIEIVCQAANRGLIELTSAHDCDLVPWDPINPEDDLDDNSQVYNTLVAIRGMLEENSVGFHTMTTNLHSDPIFKQGGLANPDPKIRELAKLKVRRTIRIGAFLGARKFTYWTARDGWTVGIKTDFGKAYEWIRQGLNDARDYIKGGETHNYINGGYANYEGGTIEPKPNEPTGHSFLQTAGHAVGFIHTLEDPGFWGVNPELTQHEGMALLDAPTCVAYLTACKKLSFLHFGNQIKAHEDNDFPPLVGPEGLKETATMFWILQKVGWRGVVEFDCHMLRSEGDPKNQAGCLLQFIENCSTGLAVSLIMANRLAAFDHLGHEELGESRADLASTAEMCGVSKELIAQWRSCVCD